MARLPERLPERLTLTEASRTLQQLTAALAAEPSPVIDAAGLVQLDSSALSVLLECRRQARRRGQVLRIENPPGRLTDLARLYGVDGLLGW